MIFRVLRRLWIPLVVLVVIGAGGFTVSRLHGILALRIASPMPIPESTTPTFQPQTPAV